jgi:hypothetical protein
MLLSVDFSQIRYLLSIASCLSCSLHYSSSLIGKSSSSSSHKKEMTKRRAEDSIDQEKTTKNPTLEVDTMDHGGRQYFFISVRSPLLYLAGGRLG